MMPSRAKLRPSGQLHESVRASASREASLSPVATQSAALRNEARQTQPLEPILFPKLRICFADFPYLHCSINQRLFTLET